MISAGEFRNDVTFEMDGDVWQVIQFQHVKPGKGAAFVRTKIRNLMTGAVIEKSFSPTERFPRAHIDTKEMQYLYNDGDIYYFMDLDTYEQIPLSKDQVEDVMLYLKESDNATVRFYKDEAFSVQPPIAVTLEVTETEPAAVGNTATNVTKPAVVETGATVTVPAFINTGDLIRIDTRTGEYMERA